MPQNAPRKSQNMLSSMGKGLAANLELQAEVARCKKALRKRPEARTPQDINALENRTSSIALLQSHGPAVHKDVCHIMRLKSLTANERLDIDQSNRMAFYVLHGLVKVVRLETTGRKLGRGQSAKARKSESATSEKEKQRIARLQALFKEIDADGSGSVDADELEDALLAAGVEVNHDALVGMLNAVDEDGSGEIEFDEFCLIMDKLTGTTPDSDWVVEKEGDVKVEIRTFGPGQFHSAAALDDAEHDQWPCKVLALEDSDLVVIAHAEYVRVMESGFSGDLNKKAELLSKVPMLRAALGTEHGGAFRQLAHIAEQRSFGRGREVATQGHAATHLFVITEGRCHVVVAPGRTARPLPRQQAKPGSASGERAGAGGGAEAAAAAQHNQLLQAAAAWGGAPLPGQSTETEDGGRVHLPAKGPHSAQRLAGAPQAGRKVELAALLAGDTFGEDALADAHHSLHAAPAAEGGGAAGGSGAGKQHSQLHGHHGRAGLGHGRGAHSHSAGPLHSRAHAPQRHPHGGGGGSGGGGGGGSGPPHHARLSLSSGQKRRLSQAGVAGGGDGHGHLHAHLHGHVEGGDDLVPRYSASLVAQGAVTVLALPRADLLRLGPHELSVMREYAAMRGQWRDQVVAERLAAGAGAGALSAPPAAAAGAQQPGAAAAGPAAARQGPEAPRHLSTAGGSLESGGAGGGARSMSPGPRERHRGRRDKLREAIGAKGRLPAGLWQPERPKFSSLGAGVGDLQRTVQPALTAGAQAFCALRPDSRRGFVTGEGKSFMRRPSTSNTDYALEQELEKIAVPGPAGFAVQPGLYSPPPPQPHQLGQHRLGAWVTPPLGPPPAPIPPRPYSALVRSVRQQQRDATAKGSTLGVTAAQPAATAPSTDAGGLGATAPSSFFLTELQDTGTVAGGDGGAGGSSPLPPVRRMTMLRLARPRSLVTPPSCNLSREIISLKPPPLFPHNKPGFVYE